MKLPTLTAITLATAVLAGPAFAATANAPATATNENPTATAAVPNAGTPPANDHNTAALTGATTATPNTATANPGAAATANPSAPATSTKTLVVTTPAPNKSGQVAAATTPEMTATTGTATPGMGLTNNPIGTANVVPNKNNNNANNNALPHQRNPVLADNGLPRAGKMIGSNVFDTQNKHVGSVSDILMGWNGRPDKVVLNLANGNKKVLVPFKDFVFGDAQISAHNRVILPNQTEAALNQQPAFAYHANNNNGVIAGHNPVLPPPRTVAPAQTAANAPVAIPETTRANNALVGPTTEWANRPLGTVTVMNSKQNALPHQRNPVLADFGPGEARAGKVIGSAVFNANDQKVGSVDDILMGVNGKPDQAVIHVDNADKKVLVPFKKLIFGNTNISGDNRVILPDQTQRSLADLPVFNYDRNA